MIDEGKQSPVQSLAGAIALTIAIFLGCSLGTAILVRRVGLALGLPLGALVFPFVILNVPFLILGAGVWWAWQDFKRKDLRRLFLVMFLYAEAFAIAYVLSAIHVGLLPRRAG